MPLDVLEHYELIDLHAAFRSLNGMPFMHTKLANLYFLSIQHRTSRNAAIIKTSLKNIKDKYGARDFTVAHLHAENEFNVNDFDEVLRPTLIHIYAAKEHVGVIGRSIRTVKERCRCVSEYVKVVNGKSCYI